MQRTPRSGARLLNVDALRGFALLGILAVNIWVYADPYYAASSANPLYLSGLDQAVRFLVTCVFETKFYLLFSFLFGYSFTLQMASAERAKASFGARMLRRQGGLLMLGLLHGALLYHGDILSLYALLGLVLLACKNMAPRSAIKASMALVGMAGLVWMALGLALLGLDWWMPGWAAETAPDSGHAVAAATRLAFRGTALATLHHHATQLPETAVALVLLQAPSAMAMFFLGFAAGRVGLLERPALSGSAMRRIAPLALLLGLLGSVLYAWVATYAPGSGLEIAAYGVGLLTAPLLTACYAAAALALFRTAWGQRIERALAPMGKMALSNYLAQSVMLGVLFTGYGWGLVDRLAPLAVLALVPVVFLAQMAWSHWWIKRHLYGPAEWVLRAITLAATPPWLRPLLKSTDALLTHPDTP